MFVNIKLKKEGQISYEKKPLTSGWLFSSDVYEYQVEEEIG